MVLPSCKSSLFLVFVGLDLLLLSLPPGASSVYQEECNSLDSAMSALITNVQELSQNAPSCVKSADCTSFSCSFELFSLEMQMEVILSPCSSPPQMTFNLNDKTGSFDYNKNITQQTNFPLPDIGLMQSSIRVDFQPVNQGIEFGIFLEMSPGGVYPLIPDQVIKTPPCDSVPYTPRVTVPGAVFSANLGNGKCQDMNEMLRQANIPTGFNCYSNEDCMGFHCNGTGQGEDLYLILHMDPCSTPVSYNITVVSSALNLNWSHNFTHSETVTIYSEPPLTFKLAVTMNPNPSGDRILTTIKITGCMKTFLDQVLCPINKVLIDNEPIPVAACVISTQSPSTASVAMVTPSQPTSPSASMLTSNQSSSALTPMVTPSHSESVAMGTSRASFISVVPTPLDECTSWANIIHNMTQSAKGLGTMSCNVTANCTGIICLDTFSGEDYIAHLDLRNCLTPVELWMSIRSESGSINWQRTITHAETFEVPGSISVASFIIKLEKRDDEHVELGMDVQFKVLGFSYTDTLIEDQLIPVQPCNDTKPTMEASGLTTELIGDKPNKVPIKEDGGSNNVGIVFGVLLAGLVVLCVIAGLMYVNRRRRYIRADETALVEDNFAEM